MTLSETAALTKKALAVFLIVIVLYSGVKISWGAIQTIRKKLNPPPPPSPTMEFGKLPPLNLPSLEIEGKPAYTLDTITGALPEFSDRLPVYQTKKVESTILAGKKARSLAHGLGFSGDAAVSADEHLWRDEKLDRTLKVNIATGEIILSTDPSSLAQTIPGSIPHSSEAKLEAQRFLAGKDLLTKDYEEGKTETDLVKSTGTALTQAASLAEAHFVRVNFYRKDLSKDQETFPILPPNPKRPPVWVGVSRTTGRENVPFLEHFVQEIDYEKSSTYPLKPIEKAWEEVTQNTAKIAHLRREGADPEAEYQTLNLRVVSVRKIYLAYFDDTQPQDFLQPIYVFEGKATTVEGEKADYISYVPAIDPSMIEE